MPPVEAPPSTQEVQNEPENISKPMVGIIYPPPEVRNIVDKTASFVARNGPSFEDRIRANELNNPKFNFLTSTDPYHAYYQHKVKEFSEGKGQDAASLPTIRPSAIPRAAPQEAAKVHQEPAVPKEPPPEPEFICDPPSISAFDLDVVKLTAQFVARNGRQFLTTLMNKEQRNYQFDFLRPQHSLFNYFTKLVEQYTKVMIPPKDVMSKLKKESKDPKAVLSQVQYRVLWTRHQEQERRKEEDAKERERVAYAQIDWHDFVVVETVDYQPNEMGLFPAPTTPDEVGARMLIQERIDTEQAAEDAKKVMAARREADAANDVEMQLSDEEAGAEDMEEASDEEVEMPPPKLPQQAALPGQPPLMSTGEPIIIRSYDPKQARPIITAPTKDSFLISPLTMEKIPAHKVEEHMKISLLDPKWREQKERQIREKKESENVFDAGVNIEANLRGIAERRTDIFGVGGEEAEIGKKIGEEESGRPDKVVWDGHSASMEKVSQKARENISIDEQIKGLHKIKGLVEDENKTRIGPSITQGTSLPSQSSVQAMSRLPPRSIAESSLPKPAPAAVPPPAQATPVLQLQPQGVPAPQSLIMAGRPGMVMMPTAQPPQPILPPRPLIGMPLGAPLTAPLASVPPLFRPVMPPTQMAVAPPVIEDEPPSKRSKNEEALVPEDHWLAQRPAPVNVIVNVPSMSDKPEWNLNGQTLTFTFNPRETCGTIKTKISQALGMPTGKQKLQYEGLFIKDSNSLAYYNFMPDSVVQLSTKERGGRKK